MFWDKTSLAGEQLGDKRPNTLYPPFALNAPNPKVLASLIFAVLERHASLTANLEKGRGGSPALSFQQLLAVHDAGQIAVRVVAMETLRGEGRADALEVQDIRASAALLNPSQQVPKALRLLGAHRQLHNRLCSGCS
jgi:hypothetical protein